MGNGSLTDGVALLSSCSLLPWPGFLGCLLIKQQHAKCSPGTDLAWTILTDAPLRWEITDQIYNSYLVTAYWYRANQSEDWPHGAMYTLDPTQLGESGIDLRVARSRGARLTTRPPRRLLARGSQTMPGRVVGRYLWSALCRLKTMPGRVVGRYLWSALCRLKTMPGRVVRRYLWSAPCRLKTMPGRVVGRYLWSAPCRLKTMPGRVVRRYLWSAPCRLKTMPGRVVRRYLWSAPCRLKTMPGSLFVCWLLNVPATCECISGTDLHRQFYVLPHWDRSCRSNFPSHPVTVYWHQADQSQCWPYNARRLAG